MALELLLRGELRPEAEPLLLAQEQVEELEGHVPLDHEVVGGDRLERLADLAADPLRCTRRTGPATDRDPRSSRRSSCAGTAGSSGSARRAGWLPRRAAGERPRRTPSRSFRISGRRSGSCVLASPGRATSPRAPRRAAALPLGPALLWRLRDLVVRRGLGLVDVRVLREHQLQQHPHPHLAWPGLAVRKPADVSVAAPSRPLGTPPRRSRTAGCRRAARRFWSSHPLLCPFASFLARGYSRCAPSRVQPPVLASGARMLATRYHIC